jgi:hypothetical protein
LKASDRWCRSAPIVLKVGTRAELKVGTKRRNQPGAAGRDLEHDEAGIPEGWSHLLHTRQTWTDAQTELHRPHQPPRSTRSSITLCKTAPFRAGHSEGRCHVYVDASAICPKRSRHVDSKRQNSRCATRPETMLVHRDIANAFQPPAADAQRARGIALRGCERTQSDHRLRSRHRGGLAHEYSTPSSPSRRGQPAGRRRPHQPTAPAHGQHPGPGRRYRRNHHYAGDSRTCSPLLHPLFGRLMFGFGAEDGTPRGRPSARAHGAGGPLHYKYRRTATGTP